MRISKEITKKLLGIVLVLAMAVTSIPTSILAAEKESIPSKVRVNSDTWNDTAIEIQLADATHTVANIKSDSKNAIAKITSLDVRSEEGEDADIRNKISIGVYAKKDGTYTISFDILDKDGLKVSTKKVKVYAYRESALKSLSVEGSQKNSSLLSKKSGKVKVTLKPGNKLKKLEYGVYSPKENSNNREIKYKQFKNGAKITYGTNPYYYESEYTSEYNNYYSYYMNTSLVAPTYIRITYIDKYTKQEETMTSYYYRIIEQQ